MPRILIDADGCPVVKNTINIAKEYNIEVIILCDTAHQIASDYANARTITVSKGADSVDFKLVNMILPNDIVITQDYGLAAMCIAKKAIVINQNGMEYTDENINALLMARHTSRKIRMSGGRTKGLSKRTEQQNIDFEQSLTKYIKTIL